MSKDLKFRIEIDGVSLQISREHMKNVVKLEDEGKDSSCYVSKLIELDKLKKKSELQKLAMERKDKNISLEEVANNIFGEDKVDEEIINDLHRLENDGKPHAELERLYRDSLSR